MFQFCCEFQVGFELVVRMGLIFLLIDLLLMNCRDLRNCWKEIFLVVFISFGNFILMGEGIL